MVQYLAMGLALMGEPAIGKADRLARELGISFKEFTPQSKEYPYGVRRIGYKQNVDDYCVNLAILDVNHEVHKGPIVFAAAIATYENSDDSTLKSILGRKVVPHTIAFWPFCETNQEFEKKISGEFPTIKFLLSHEHPINQRLEDLARELLPK